MKQKGLLLPALALFGFFNYGMVRWLQSGHGLAGFWQSVQSDWLLAMTLVDAAVFVTLVVCWLWKDAARRNRPTWQRLLLVLATLVFGAVVPLLYLAFRKKEGDAL